MIVSWISEPRLENHSVLCEAAHARYRRIDNVGHVRVSGRRATSLTSRGTERIATVKFYQTSARFQLRNFETRHVRRVSRGAGSTAQLANREGLIGRRYRALDVIRRIQSCARVKPRAL